MPKAYVQHENRVAQTDERFKHVMALALNPQSDYKDGVIRCITSRSGDVGAPGNIDRSELHLITASTLEECKIEDKLKIHGEEELVASLTDEHHDFLGFEDPDIWIDKNGLQHLYFTIPFISKSKPAHLSGISLGHAVGKDLYSLKMTEPVLMASTHAYNRHQAKEVCIAPLNSKGIHLNLFESSERHEDLFYPSSQREGATSFSVVGTAIAKDMGQPWEWGGVAFHPAEHKIPWVAEHASPGPLLPREFIDLGPGKAVGILNGRGVTEQKGELKKYGKFSVGLFIYDYEKGTIDWVSPEPLISDTEATNITFASQFIQTGKGEGILYAHIDDSFVRAYTLFEDGIRTLLP